MLTIMNDDVQDLDAVEALIQGLVLFQGGICMVYYTTLSLNKSSFVFQD